MFNKIIKKVFDKKKIRKKEKVKSVVKKERGIYDKQLLQKLMDEGYRTREQLNDPTLKKSAVSIIYDNDKKKSGK